MKLKCRLGFHEWKPWGKLVEGYVRLTQFRVCGDCNKMQYRSVYGNQANPNDANRTTKQDSNG